jgi:predicted amidohydrolase/ribosomal protein S18 acetylase RimI-like enzyme
MPTEEIDLSEFETRINLRPLRNEDYDELVALQLECFPGMNPWKKDHVESQLAIFPEGQIVVELEGKIVASSSSLIVDFADYKDWNDWVELSDSGYIKNHDPEGDTLYGIEIMVHPEYRGMKLSRRLYDARKELCREKNLARMMIGGRIPGYAPHKDAMTAQQYVERVMEKALYDPVLTAQLSNGFQLRQLVPDYLPSDEDSAGYATCMEWPNLDHRPAKVGTRASRSVGIVRVAAIQYPVREIDTFEDFEQQCEYFVDVASDAKTDFVLFPELFTLQLLSTVKKRDPGAAARELAKLTPKYLELFTDLAVRFNVNIIGGSQFTVEGEWLHNVSYLFRRDGTLGKQYKIHVTPNESRWWGVQGGEKIEVFDTDRGKIAIFVCYDIEFPELARIATSKGARILFVPYNTSDRYGYLRVRYCSQARCIENHVYVVTAGCVGNLPFVDNADIHTARSGIYTPSDISFARDGIAAEADTNLEAVVVNDLDTELLRRHRRTGTVQNWNDRRVDLYKVHWKEGEEPSEV